MGQDDAFAGPRPCVLANVAGNSFRVTQPTQR